MSPNFVNFTRILTGGNRTAAVSPDSNGSAADPTEPLIGTDEQPLRLELFSIDQLGQHAKSLAGWHVVKSGRGADRLLPRLDENERVLLRAYELVNTAASKNRRIAPAGEWLLDNFYLVEEQIRTARRHLPKNYSRELPRLSSGSNADFPRVYDIAMELISHVDGRVDAENLTSFVDAYQSVAPLKIGELWAVPIMLRLALIENLRRVAARIASGRQDRDRANVWADRMVEVSEKDPKSLVLVLADMVRENPALTTAFVAEISRRLQGQTPTLALPMTWIEQNLAETATTVNEMVQSEGQHQAADQVSIGNSIGSLRFLTAMDWREFVESLSVVEQTLRSDPSGTYAAMDFGTRDRYRHAVEKIARRTDLDEDAVATEAIKLATDARDGGDHHDGHIQESTRTSHVGYWLINKGLPTLEKRVQMKRTIGQTLSRIARRFPLTIYGGLITLVTLTLTVLTLWFGARHGLSHLSIWLLAVPLHVSLSQLVVALTNWASTALVSPRTLPRMDFDDGIPEHCQTIVVVPTMLSSERSIEEMLETLEVRFLANRDPHIRFALLTDFRDAAEESLSTDDTLLTLAKHGVEELNDRYADAVGGTPFLLFHRPRKHNPSEDCWMGWERKRGKLADFNAVLRGGPTDRFSAIVGDTTILPSVKYVITLDTDTQLPRDAARELIGAMAHPLNRPRYDDKTGRVVEGYTILQPRVAVSLPSAGRSWFVRLFAGEPGIDPYTRSVSDVYQDLFEEGSFIGKGIYDVDAFEQALGSRFPENRILSHDLLEGSYARAGLITDVELYEDHPSHFSADVSRRHRWIRGDWQISSWILPRVPGVDLSRVRNPISGLSRWKILDNLRRSLVPIAMTLLFLLAWSFPGPAVALTLIALAVCLLPPVVHAISALSRRPSDLPRAMYLRIVGASSLKHLVQGLFAIVFIPYDAFISLDAIARTCGRLVISRRSLLQWQTSSDAERSAQHEMSEMYFAMIAGPIVGIVALIALAIFHRSALPLAGVIAALWIASPSVAWFISRPIQKREPRLTKDDTLFLRKLSRRTWQFYERFVDASENYLPPDNFQEHPTAVIAHRTSPTNVGLALLCNLSAYDFGYISAARLAERTEHTLATTERLEKCNGHLYNWYDTLNLSPLMPLYVSTVDSGNLAGHLLTLRQGLLGLESLPILPSRVFAGLEDVAAVLNDLLRSAPTVDRPRRAMPSELLTRFDRLRTEFAATHVESETIGLRRAKALLDRSIELANDLVAALEGADDPDLTLYANSFALQTADLHGDLLKLAPWLVLPATGDEAIAAALNNNNMTLGQLAQLSASNDLDAPLREAIIAGSTLAARRLEQFDGLAHRAGALVDAMDWEFLFDPTRDLLAIGYNAANLRLDGSFYDLLASEARLASFVCIAQGKLPQAHWFALGRLLTNSGREPALLSWSGSMFEYLMPLLVMPTYDGTILDQTYRAVIKRQIEYGAQRGVPWGVSESGYNTTDAALNYQYRAFGVPGLGFKRGLAEDLVIAPYACVMGLMVDPEESVRNLQRLAKNGLIGAYGFYEAVDYTPARVPRGKEFAVVRSFMVHHEGMSLLSLAYLLLDRPMQKRFESDPTLRATDLLLQERVPKVAPVFPHASEVAGARRPTTESNATLRVFNTPQTPAPEVHLLSNGRYQVMVTASGGGYSRWRDLAVTRWREDATRDNYGSFVYLRDVTPVAERAHGAVGAAATAAAVVSSAATSAAANLSAAIITAPASSSTPPGEAWSVAYQPTLRNTRRYEAIFPQARAEFRCVESEIESYTEIAVSPEDDIELRRVTITNRSRSKRVIEVTTYAEVVLAPAAADAAHSTFSNLFVQTELIRNRGAILCTRRPRSAGEKPPWMLHLTTVHGTVDGDVSFETDRSKFIGRGRTTASPISMDRGTSELTDSEGSVLDPIVAVRRRIILKPQESTRIDIVTGVTETRDAAMSLVEKYHDRRLADRVFELSWTHSAVVLRQLNATESEAQLYGRLASSILFSNPARRAAPGIISRNRRGQSGLWSYGISGDLPIVLLRVTEQAKLDFVKQIVQAHAYWRLKGLSVDLVIWNEDPSGYRQALQDSIMGMIAGSAEGHMLDKPAGIFVRRLDQIADEDRLLIQSVARVILADTNGTLEEQIEKRIVTREGPPRFVPTRQKRLEPPVAAEIIERDLAFKNGHGGFTHDGREYVVVSSPENVTPAPWCNVLANAYFGSVVSESGSAYTWLENAHEFRLSPWYNDPVSDTTGEAFYIRDEETGKFWSPSPLPARGAMPYTTRHGFGYSVFEYSENGIASEMWMYVAVDAPVKFVTIRLRNTSGRPRKVSVTGYCEWVLGELRAKSMASVVTEIDLKSGAMLAKNAYSHEFADRVAFFDCGEASTRTVSGDRTEFLGRNGSHSAPAAMGRTKLSGRVGAGIDPCAAMQTTTIDLGENQERDVVFLIGCGRDEKDVRELISRFRGPQNARRALEQVWNYWNKSLSTVTVETPDPALNVLANGWLPYQVLACRVWARSGFYQSGGAFGFRDQLQDVMSLLYSEPKLYREHMLKCASRQFKQGDVQHWWHPPVGRGVRTHFSDDYLWLPYACIRYVNSTGDTGVLDEKINFLDGRPVNVDEESYYDLPNRSDEVQPFYEHCKRSVENGLRFGVHGLPLMGCGDWNDGMNLIGEHGKGESVWLAFFLFSILRDFADIARSRGDAVFADKCAAEAEKLRVNIEANAWDGAWYRRAYFDDGSPLGSASNPECQIDSLPQSWAVLSGGGDAARARQGMAAVDQRLVKRNEGLIQLFDPPFDKSPLNPGYIKGYVPGVRENGGQYTHAAVWTVMAYAASGDTERAWELFNLINPIHHGDSAEKIATYKVEPYVAAADVYAVSPHIGRGGWTWYTGSAGWMYRLITESLLGIRLHVDRLRFEPVVPTSWKEFTVHYRFRETLHHITIRFEGPGRVTRKVLVDGIEQADQWLPLVDDRREHRAEVIIG